MRHYLLYIIVLTSTLAFSQKSLSDLLKKHNSGDIPYITVQELAMPKTNAIILDARELREYQVSHIKGAFQIGYDAFRLDRATQHIQYQNDLVVVYCSLGIRSERIALQLREAGYTNVKNLYGGIFEWKNQDFQVFDKDNKETENIHAFSKSWAKWLHEGNKVFDKKSKTN